MDIAMRKKLQEWMHRMLFSESTDRGPLVKFSVRHCKASGQYGSEIGTVPISSEVNSPEEIPLWASQLDKMTVDDAVGVGGMQRYAILAFFRSETGEISSGPRFVLRVYGGNEETEDGSEDAGIEATESPTSKGLATQLMRHNEIMFKMSTATTAQTIATLQRENARLATMNEEFLAKQIELIETLESLKTQKHERELASATALMKQDAIRDLANKGMHLAPILINAIAKKRLLPEKTTPIEQMVHSFAQSVNPGQMNEILGKLNPEQQASLLSIFQEMFKFELKTPEEGEKPRDGTERANQSTGLTVIKS